MSWQASSKYIRKHKKKLILSFATFPKKFHLFEFWGHCELDDDVTQTYGCNRKPHEALIRKSSSMAMLQTSRRRRES